MSEITVFDHYELLRRDDGSLFELGRGSMGITYKAFDTNLQCPVALKVINAAAIHSEVARQRFVREARAAAALRHRHVASVFHLGLEGDTYFYAMEFIDGETVEALVRRLGRLNPPLALNIATQVARALNAAQKLQLVHRDIKPSNLMLIREEEEEFVVKVIDFGLVKSSDDGETEPALSVHGFVGTPHFASPEQLEERDLDVRSDIYSLGATLWYMLAGEPPFSGATAQVMSHQLHTPPPLEKIQGVPESVRKLLARMLAKDPADRPQTAQELRAELEQCADELAAPAQPTEKLPALPPVSPPTPRNAIPWTAVLTGAAGLALLLALLGFWMMMRTSSGTRSPAPAAGPAFSAAPSPTATPDPDAPFKARFADAQRYEEARDWARAIQAYADIMRDFPGRSDAGRAGLDRVFASLSPALEKMSAAEFEPLRAAVTTAAGLDVVPAMMALASHLRKAAPADAFAWYCDASAHQYAPAMTQAGLMISKGAGVPANLPKAAVWFQMASSAGDSAGTTCLAECYLYGAGVRRDDRRAVELLGQAANAGDARAMNLLGTCAHQGLGTPKNYEECRRLFSAASDLGLADASGNLGVLYMNGEGVPRDQPKAVRLFDAGARNGSAYCMYLLAKSLEYGTGVQPNAADAAEWYRRAAAGGNPMALEWCKRRHLAVPSPAP